MLFEGPILTAEEMRSAEQAVISAGTSAETLMERAGAAAAEAIRIYAGPMRTLILCGPGNNGADGHVVARLLRERGVEVEVAGLDGLSEAKPAPLLVDALFGTGLNRGLDASTVQALGRLAASASVRVALDLPSGVSTDDGACLSPIPFYDLTIAFGAAKPAHFLQPAARHMGRLVIAGIGIPVESRLQRLGRPDMAAPGPDDHKYSRGYVAIVAGEMPGAAALAANAAARAGAGYVRLIAKDRIPGVLQSVVQSRGDRNALLDDDRIGALLVGPGLGRGKDANALLQQVLALDHPLIVDGDALRLLENTMLATKQMLILTPHAGEFVHLFGTLSGSKVDQARSAASASHSVIVFKGPDTVIAAPDGRAALAPAAPHWLASAGTGDVLAGIIAALRARGQEAFEAACAGVWLHGRAAERAGPGLVADDLAKFL
ncbi:MAG: NAD(P)H-hydrate dehydratase [Sphingosinicella sp.]|nr:NAD(P)H-hydrate dehydratase [Sphingosinicella sp.]